MYLFIVVAMIQKDLTKFDKFMSSTCARTFYTVGTHDKRCHLLLIRADRPLLDGFSEV